MIAQLPLVAAGFAALALAGLIALTWFMVGARALFAVAMSLAAFGALAALAAFAMHAPAASFAIIGCVAILSPIILLGATLLTQRIVRARRGRAIATSIGLAAVIGLTLWLARDLPARAAAPETEGGSLLLGVLIACGGLSGFGLLAFGERGGFDARP